MNCPMESQESSALLLAFSSNRLDPDRAVPVQRHVETCSACQQFLAGQAAVWEALDMWKPEPVSADFDRRLYQRIDQHVSWWDLLLRPFRPATLSQGLPIAAAAGVLIMAGLLLNRPAVEPVSLPQQSAQVEALPADQVEHAVDDMETLNQFNHLMMRSEPADSDAKM